LNGKGGKKKGGGGERWVGRLEGRSEKELYGAGHGMRKGEE